MKKRKEIRITYELDDWIESFITTAKVVFVIIQHSNMVSGPFMVLFFCRIGHPFLSGICLSVDI
jgi:hypothetical protein